MDSDSRHTTLFVEAEGLIRASRRPGTGQISDAVEIHATQDGKSAVFAGSILDELHGLPPTRICRIDLDSGDLRVLTYGPNIDRMPKYSSDGTQIAFLSDRQKSGVFQLYLLDVASGAAHQTPKIDGCIEYLAWSPDGRQIMLGVAGLEADSAGAHGAKSGNHSESASAPWMPRILPDGKDSTWRHIWIYDCSTQQVRRIGSTRHNVWEAAWCGNRRIAAAVSLGPEEGLWYSAFLIVFDVETGESHLEYHPRDQIGLPAASTSGKYLALVLAICSDRWIVAGQLQLFDVDSGSMRSISTRGVDISCTEWCSDTRLLLAGHRNFESVVLLYDVLSDTVEEIWASDEISTGGRYFTVCGIGDTGDCAMIAESFQRAPEIGVVRRSTYQRIRSLDLGYNAEASRAIHSVKKVEWIAEDGLTIQGLLLLPFHAGPHPILVDLHGGPVWLWRPRWLARGTVYALMLLKRGYAVFLPNPRGSSGRGRGFIERVKHDLGGADARDCLSGLDYLVKEELADPTKIGVTGVSYGGYLASWLITQDSRFAAAIPVSPITNFVTEHLISNIADFVSIFLGDTYDDRSGKYFSRSPIMHARKTRTPTLSVCGALDRCTPPEEATQFHSALLGHGVKSALAVYPEEGHGIRSLPATIDFSARAVEWFEDHLKTESPH